MLGVTLVPVVLMVLATVHAGALTYRPTSLKAARIGLVLACLFPFSAQLPRLWSVHLVTVFDYWYALLFLVAFHQGRWKSARIVRASLVGVAVSLLFNLCRVLRADLFVIAADFRFLFYVLTWSAVSKTVEDSLGRCDRDGSRVIDAVFVILGLKAALFLALIDLVHVAPLAEDPYTRHVLAADNRFMDLSLFVGCFLLVSGRAKATLLRLAALALGLLVSGSRTYLLAFLLAIPWGRHRRGSVGYLVAAVSVVVAALLVLRADGRYGHLLDPAALESELATRFSPFLDKVRDYGPLDWLFGRGVGTSFEVPWFGFLPGGPKENNPYVDNLFLTLFAKYGVSSIVVLFSFFRVFLSAALRSARARVAVFVTIVSITTSFGYQLSFGGTIFALLLLSCCQERESESGSSALSVSPGRLRVECQKPPAS